MKNTKLLSGRQETEFKLKQIENWGDVIYPIIWTNRFIQEHHRETLDIAAQVTSASDECYSGRDKDENGACPSEL
jgi:hypothetical protein